MTGTARPGTPAAVSAGTDATPAKTALRRRVRSARTRLDPRDRPHLDRALGETLAAALPLLLPGGLAPREPVPVYVDLPHEPPTDAIRVALRAAGARVLLPWLRDDADLDWVGEHQAATVDAMRPPGDLLGRSAVLGCRLLLVPALAVDTRGHRLGQGGGSYDRVLARVRAAPSRALVLAVVHETEIMAAETGAFEVQEHDVRVDGALTPRGVHRFYA